MKQFMLKIPVLYTLVLKPFSKGSKWEDCPASEATIFATAGASYLCGDPKDRPVPPGPNLPDLSTSVFAACGICAAVYQRENTGKGQYICVSQEESIIAHSRSAYETYYEYGGNVRAGNGFPSIRKMSPQDLYPTKGNNPDSDWITIGCPSDKNFSDFCNNVWNRPEMALDPRFSTANARQENIEELNAEISKFTLTKDKFELMDLILRKNRITAAAVMSIKELTESEELRKRGDSSENR